jgi:hypothetical protein
LIIFFSLPFLAGTANISKPFNDFSNQSSLTATIDCPKSVEQFLTNNASQHEDILSPIRFNVVPALPLSHPPANIKNERESAADGGQQWLLRKVLPPAECAAVCKYGWREPWQWHRNDTAFPEL